MLSNHKQRKKMKSRNKVQKQIINLLNLQKTEDEDNPEESNADEEFEGQEFQSDRQTPLGTCFVSICDELFEIDFQDIPFLGSA